jgi:hypothetical protein
LLDIAVDDLKGDEFVIGRVAAGDEEKGGVAAIDYLAVWGMGSDGGHAMNKSRHLYIRGSCTFSYGETEQVERHL